MSDDLFENQREANLESTIAMVEDVLIDLGHFVNDARIEIDGAARAWRVTRGSASIEISLIERASFPHLRVSSAVFAIDEKVDREGLYHHLLTLNGAAIINAAFAVRDDQVVLLSERSTHDLDRSEVFDLVLQLSTYADEYDDELASRFGASVS